MSPLGYFIIEVVTLLVLVGLYQVDLVQTFITNSGIAGSQLFEGIFLILTFFYTADFVLSFGRHR